jgi:hypothetical protein
MNGPPENDTGVAPAKRHTPDKLQEKLFSYGGMFFEQSGTVKDLPFDNRTPVTESEFVDESTAPPPGFFFREVKSAQIGGAS